MTNEKETDRIAGHLMNIISNALKEDLYGKDGEQSQAYIDDMSLLSSIKDFVTHSVLGKKESEQEKPTQTHPKPVLTSAPVSAQVEQEKEQPEVQTPASISSIEEDWDEMRHRQEREREELHWRHEQERENMQHRHEQERKAQEFKREHEGKPEDKERDPEKEERDGREDAPGWKQGRGNREKRGRGH